MAAPPTTAVVKSVLSGDTIVIWAKSVNGPPSEAVLGFTNVVSPRMGEPFAFEAKCFLSSIVTGNQIKYKVDSSGPSRQYCTAIIRTPIDGETNLAKIMLRAGLAKLGKSQNPELVLLEEEAKSLGRGMWGDPVLPPKVSHSIEDHRAFFNAHSRTPIPAIVEQVRDGSTLRCLLLLPNNVHQSIIINIAGIKCPIFCKNVPNMPDVVEPFSQEAKYFVETRLLQRKVEIQLETITGSMFYASIIFPAGNIALLLLSNGYAKVVEWNLNTIKGDKTPYIEAEAIAIQKKLRLWKETAKTKISADTFEAVVHRAPGTDHIIVYYQDQERKLQISSIRGPKRQKNEQDFDIGYYVDAIEFIRSRLVGQKVSVKVDYVKPRDGQYGPRDCCTIMLDGVDIGEQLVAHGLASVLKHKKDDHNRSSRYDFLIQAEEKAAEEGKGIHSKKDLPVHRYVDVTENVQKAKSFLPSLQRSGKLNAIVEFVSSGSRYRLLVPSQNCRMTFVLAGVKLPRPPKGEKDTGEPYGQEAVNFCNKIAIQRQVEIQAHSVDKVGMFIGTMNVQTENGLKDLGLMLVDAGFASVHDFSAASLPLYHQLKQAEDRAKQARKNIWLDYSEKSEDTENISEVVNAKLEGCVLIVKVTKIAEKLEEFMSRFALAHVKLGQDITIFTPKVGDLCSAQFTDKSWYRAKVLGVENNRYTVHYIDYGNSETLPGSRIRPLPVEFQNLQPMAHKVYLAFIEITDDDEYRVDALQTLSRSVENAKLVCQKVFGDKVNLFKSDNSTVSEELLRQGYAFIPRKSKQTEFLEASEEEAKTRRRNIWCYGDFTE